MKAVQLQVPSINGMKRLPVFTIILYFDLVYSITIDVIYQFFVKEVFNVILQGIYTKCGDHMSKQVTKISQKLKVYLFHDTKQAYWLLDDIDYIKAEKIMYYLKFFIMPIVTSITVIENTLKDNQP
jgi:hypothetical protein